MERISVAHAQGRFAAQDRQLMIDQTGHFLTWALAHPEFDVRIPRRRLGTGGFSQKIKRAFWGHAVSEVTRQLHHLSTDDRF